MASPDKDTIYIDIDDEITGIIDKLQVSKGKVVALVLPKRAAVFQSIVNMKLLKRAADSSSKHLVLITSEAGLLPLAGAAGVHVAKTLTSKPEIPSAPDQADTEEEVDEEESVDDTGDPVDANKPVGDLAAGAAAAEGVETVVLDDEDVPPEADAASAAAAGPKTFEPKKKPKKNKKLAVPNFERFRKWLIIGGAALLLFIIFLLFLTFAKSKATISIKTDAANLGVNQSLSLSTTAKELDPDSGTVPAKVASQQKTFSQQVPTTGQKNSGNKASGTVTVTNCSDATVTLAAGNGFRSSAGNTYISQEAVDVPGSDFFSNGKCKNNGKASVSVIAQSGGTAYNMPSGAGFSVASGGNLSGQGGTMSGGTDKIVQSVNQNDITNAKNKISANDKDVKKDLSNQLKDDNYYPLNATFVAGTPSVTTSSDVGDVATTVTVTESITYTMFGVHKDDLKTLVENNIKNQIDTSKQTILDDGIDSANYNVDNITATNAQLTMSANAAVGPDLDIANIKEQSKGKKAGAIKDQLTNDPHVTDVDVKISPFWVSTAPKNTQHITIKIAKPTTSKSKSTDANN
jgi:hypothetical protein